ncbi:hypothetical protein QAD02_011493 [Eretmocerus hayati]|uniref:Uncharacterized protein n=1 Tax=Eretmocerus hayati TaxID=131215 RepID=A0ACC2NX58_9HYME|nr:hypothetical protein QAD02_011493 [Eretmocerus hayati]
MLELNADPTIQDVHGETPLHLADRYSIDEIKNLLLLDERITKRNLVSKFGRSHFQIACSSALPKVVEKFLKQGADPNELNYFEDNEVRQMLPPISICFAFTPLHIARNPHVIKVLLKYGANPKIEDYKGWTSLHDVAYCCDADLIKTLVRYVKFCLKMNFS